jgi:hypothetical protein
VSLPGQPAAVTWFRQLLSPFWRLFERIFFPTQMPKQTTCWLAVTEFALLKCVGGISRFRQFEWLKILENLIISDD